MDHSMVDTLQATIPVKQIIVGTTLNYLL